jgi:hypothetical protein
MQKIEIYLNTDEDPSTLLDAAIEIGAELASQIDAPWGEDDENRVTVSYA